MVRTLTYITTSLLAIAAALFLVTGKAFGGPLAVDPKRAVVIEGPVGRGNLLELQVPLLGMLSDKSKPIDIVISSPGGDMVTGWFFMNILDHLRAEGATVRCFVPTMAASMAFQILLHCDQRYALEHSFLLWHGVRILEQGGDIITEGAAKDLATDLERSNEMILSDLDSVLGKFMPVSMVHYHYNHETLHLAPNVATMAPGFVVVRKSIPGLLEALANQQLPRTKIVRLQGPMPSYNWIYPGNADKWQKQGAVGGDPTALPPELEKVLDEVCTKAGVAARLHDTCVVGLRMCVLTHGNDPEALQNCILGVLNSLTGDVPN